MNERFYGKLLACAAILLFLLDKQHRPPGIPLSQVGFLIAVWATFACLLFLPRAWRTRWLTAAACAVLSAECAVGVIYFHEMRLLYLAAIVLFVAALRLTAVRSYAPAIAATALAAWLYVWFGRADLFNLLSFVILTVLVYLFTRNRMQRNAMHEANKRHLAELRDAYEQLQEASSTAIQYAVLEERTRIARDIHDAVGHSLTSLIVQMQALRYMLKDNPAQAGRSLEEMLNVAREGLQNIRASVHALADDRSVPGMTALKSLLARLESTSSIEYAFHSELGDDDASADSYALLYRVLQEAITNVMRHSGATRLEVRLSREDSGIVMRIRDNGALRPDSGMMEGFGLKTMRARLEARGGSLRHGPAEPSGFELVAAVPDAEPAGPADAKEE